MDQTAFDRWESSVPSDRFYDDFSLEFVPLGRDSIHPGCFYYSPDRRIGSADPS